ncbi:MAG: hypothetical protein K0S46_1222 [Moraxellaceae bacterium]|jgi:hypothetical protein|nr:hypothetical protein [Moraxellaceae bacterium]
MKRIAGNAAWLLLAASVAVAEGDDAKVVSGMSILGNNETPKSLYIVPWKSSEIGSETTLASRLLNEEPTPVDKPVFMRELEFHRISSADH